MVDDKTEEYRKMELAHFRAIWKELRVTNYWVKLGILHNPENPKQLFHSIFSYY